MPSEPGPSTLLFLLSLPLSLAACPGDDASTSDGATGSGQTGDSTGPGGTTGDTSATSGASGGTMDGTTEDGGSTSVAPTSSGVDTTGDTSGGLECGEFPYDVGPISDGCVAYVGLLDMCYDGPPLSAECIAYEEAVCQYQVNYDTMAAGPECAAAYEDFYACLSTLSCEELRAEEACAAEGMAWFEACFA